MSASTNLSIRDLQDRVARLEQAVKTPAKVVEIGPAETFERGRLVGLKEARNILSDSHSHVHAWHAIRARIDELEKGQK
jgi:hypothetical protein